MSRPRDTKVGWRVLGAVMVALELAACGGTADPAPSSPQFLRVEVVGGLYETGLWDALAARYSQETGDHVEVVVSGPKRALVGPFRDGRADLLTMHACDAIINLVADGYALDPQPWLKNDLIIVGPAQDPAGIQGLTDAVEALRKIAAAHAPFVIHASLGAQEVLRDLTEAGGIQLDAGMLSYVEAPQAPLVLQIAAEKNAYTLVGRIPFLSGKMVNPGLVLMVRGDPRLRRPYVVVVANQQRFPAARLAAARRLTAYLRSPPTQAWLADFGRGQIDDQPLFFPLDGLRPSTASPLGKGPG